MTDQRRVKNNHMWGWFRVPVKKSTGTPTTNWWGSVKNFFSDEKNANEKKFFGVPVNTRCPSGVPVKKIYWDTLKSLLLTYLYLGVLGVLVK